MALHRKYCCMLISNSTTLFVHKLYDYFVKLYSFTYLNPFSICKWGFGTGLCTHILTSFIFMGYASNSEATLESRHYLLLDGSEEVKI